jgi:DNA-binding transcriptional MerR regulator
METLYTIGQLARAVGLPVSTVRYYERIGLLLPDGRSAGNYRLYRRETLARLGFIQSAQAIGVTLGDITAFLHLHAGTTGICEDVQGPIEERLADLEKRMADLRRVQCVLQATLEKCRETQWRGRCQIIDRLRATSAPQP